MVLQFVVVSAWSRRSDPVWAGTITNPAAPVDLSNPAAVLRPVRPRRERRATARAADGRSRTRIPKGIRVAPSNLPGDQPVGVAHDDEARPGPGGRHARGDARGQRRRVVPGAPAGRGHDPRRGDPAHRRAQRHDVAAPGPRRGARGAADLPGAGRRGHRHAPRPLPPDALRVHARRRPAGEPAAGPRRPADQPGPPAEEGRGHLRRRGRDPDAADRRDHRHRDPAHRGRRVGPAGDAAARAPRRPQRRHLRGQRPRAHGRAVHGGRGDQRDRLHARRRVHLRRLPERVHREDPPPVLVDDQVGDHVAGRHRRGGGPRRLDPRPDRDLHPRGRRHGLGGHDRRGPPADGVRHLLGRRAGAPARGAGPDGRRTSTPTGCTG